MLLRARAQPNRIHSTTDVLQDIIAKMSISRPNKPSNETVAHHNYIIFCSTFQICRAASRCIILSLKRGTASTSWREGRLLTGRAVQKCKIIFWCLDLQARIFHISHCQAPFKFVHDRHSSWPCRRAGREEIATRAIMRVVTRQQPRAYSPL